MAVATDDGGGATMAMVADAGGGLFDGPGCAASTATVAFGHGRLGCSWATVAAIRASMRAGCLPSMMLRFGIRLWRSRTVVYDADGGGDDDSSLDRRYASGDRGGITNYRNAAGRPPPGRCGRVADTDCTSIRQAICR